MVAYGRGQPNGERRVKFVAIGFALGICCVGLRFKRGNGWGDENYVYLRVEPRTWSLELHWSDGR